MRMESGYSSSNPDIVRSRLERPFRNFKYATLYHGKAGLQSVQLYFYDESHAMKSDDMAAEVAAIKSIFEKKYGIAFNGGPTARKGDMMFRVMMTGDACIRIEVSNSKIVRQGQNFGASGGADVL